MHRIPWSKRISDYLLSRKVYFQSKILNSADAPLIKFRDDLAIEPYTGLMAGDYIPSMGAFSYTNSPMNYGIVVGRYCSIGRAFTAQGFQHPHKAISASPWVYSRDSIFIKNYLIDHDVKNNIIITTPQKNAPVLGNDVWIGNNVTLLNGIAIGDGAIIAQNSHVTKDVMPFSIVGGNPAKLIRMRFESKIIDKIIEMAWWNYDIAQFAGLDVGNPEAFIDGLAERFDTLTPYSPEPVTAAELQSVA